MLIIETDIQITRRQRLHHIVNAAGEPLWSGRSIVAALMWCLEQEEHNIAVVDDETAILLHVNETRDRDHL